MSRRSTAALVLVVAAVGVAGALLAGLRTPARARPPEVDFSHVPSIVATAKGTYVCPIRGRVEGMPPLPPPERDPACHRQTRAEASAEAERNRLLARPEVSALRSLVFCDGRVLTSDQVDQFRRTNPNIGRWIDHHPRTGAYLNLPLRPGTATSCTP